MWWLFFCAGKTECSWLLEYVWVEKEQTLIIFPQHSMVLWPCLHLHKRLLAVCNAFNVPDNFFFSSSSVSSVLTAKAEESQKST